MSRFYTKREMKLKPLPVNTKQRREMLVAMPPKEVKKYDNYKELLIERRREQKRRVIEVSRLKQKRDSLKNTKLDLQGEIEFYKNSINNLKQST